MDRIVRKQIGWYHGKEKIRMDIMERKRIVWISG